MNRCTVQKVIIQQVYSMRGMYEQVYSALFSAGFSEIETRLKVQKVIFLSFFLYLFTTHYAGLQYCTYIQNYFLTTLIQRYRP
jgi:hypothetical protein